MRGLLTDPATYGLLVAAAVALLTYSTALQRGSVTQATASLVIMETVAPALVGRLLLGDHPRPGWGWVAVVGFVLAVAGAITLSRHGDLAEEVLPAGGRTTSSPCRRVNEGRGRLCSHWVTRMVRARSAWRAVFRLVRRFGVQSSLGQLGPGQPLAPAFCVHRDEEFTQIPPEPGVRTGLGQGGVADLHHQTGQELLGRLSEPAQHEQRVLTRSLATGAESRNAPPQSGWSSPARR